jgi:ornithine lipid hydroxylase
MSKRIRQAITYGLFPIFFILAMLFTYFGIQLDIHSGYLLATVALSTAAITLFFERIHPKHKNWTIPNNDVGTDFKHALVSMIFLPQVLEALLTSVLLVVALNLSQYVGFDLWINNWPIFLQIPLAMIITGFGGYWSHRLMHEIPLLWRFHAVHHSPGRLYWLNASRFHPFDTTFSYLMSTTPLILLGVPDEILVFVTVWITVHGLFQHCNIDIKLGFLNYIFSMTELHRWHHSLKMEEANSNYGNNIIFWDIVFGTMYYPKNEEASENIGLHDIEHFPEKYLDQILIPFQWNKLAKKEVVNQMDPEKEPAHISD